MLFKKTKTKKNTYDLYVLFKQMICWLQLFFISRFHNWVTVTVSGCVSLGCH